MLIGAVQAMEEAGLKPGKDILTVSVDGTNDELKLMLEGKANATVLLNPNMGVQAYQAIKDYLAGETLPRLILVPSAMFFPDTAAAELARARSFLINSTRMQVTANVNRFVADLHPSIISEKWFLQMMDFGNKWMTTLANKYLYCKQKH